MKLEDIFNNLDPKSIWSFAQNKPTLVARDLEENFGIDRRSTHAILLARGVYKWLAVRRDLISLKDAWKHQIRNAQVAIKAAKQNEQRDRLMYLRGYLAAKEECRKEVRALCHSGRWQAPDFDSEAQKFLESLNAENR